MNKISLFCEKCDGRNDHIVINSGRLLRNNYGIYTIVTKLEVQCDHCNNISVYEEESDELTTEQIKQFEAISYCEWVRKSKEYEKRISIHKKPRLTLKLDKLSNMLKSSGTK